MNNSSIIDLNNSESLDVSQNINSKYEFILINTSEKEYKKFHRTERKTTFSINHN